MKILYLHGYKARPNYERIGYLENLGHEVIAPHIDYDNEPNIMLELLEQDYDLVIGSSLGAYTGFYISEFKSIPCVCFNPPLHMELKIKMNLPKPWDYEKGLPQTKNIILGSDDDVVNPIKVLEWLQENRPKVSVRIYDGMSHTITIEQFTEVMDKILSITT